MIRILQAQEKDIPFIVQVNRDIDIQNQVDKPSQLNEDTLKRDVFHSDPAAFVDIAFQDETPVGMVLYMPAYFASTGRVVWISQLYTHPEHRRKGIAKALVNHVKETHSRKLVPPKAICWATMEVNKDAQTAFEKIGAKKLDGILFYNIT